MRVICLLFFAFKSLTSSLVKAPSMLKGFRNLGTSVGPFRPNLFAHLNVNFTEVVFCLHCESISEEASGTHWLAMKGMSWLWIFNRAYFPQCGVGQANLMVWDFFGICCYGHWRSTTQADTCTLGRWLERNSWWQRRIHFLEWQCSGCHGSWSLGA